MKAAVATAPMAGYPALTNKICSFVNHDSKQWTDFFIPLEVKRMGITVYLPAHCFVLFRSSNNRSLVVVVIKLLFRLPALSVYL